MNQVEPLNALTPVFFIGPVGLLAGSQAGYSRFYSCL